MRSHPRLRLAFAVVVVALAGKGTAGAQSAPFVFADAGVVDGGNLSGAATTLGTAAASWFGGITVASAPLAMGRNWDFSVDARLAREPVVGMARVADGIVPAYFDALRASGSLNFVHTSGPFDVAIVGRYGETRQDVAQRLAVAHNDNGPWTFLFEATAHLRVYSPRDAAAPHALRRLMPIVDVHGGVKHDRRFHRTADIEPYDDPTGRVLGGVFVAAWRHRDGEGVPVVVVGAGADFETALRTGVRLPSAARAFARASFDLRRLAATR